MGQLLAEVESLELESLQLEALNADNDASLATRTVEQVARLVKERVISDRDLSEAQAKHRGESQCSGHRSRQMAQLGPEQRGLRAAPARAEPELIRGLPIASPISGAVIHADVAVGRVIEPTEHLFEIVDLSTVWVKVGVLERDLHKVQAGQAIELVLAAYPSEPFTSKVEVKGLYLDPQTHLGTALGRAGQPSRQRAAVSSRNARTGTDRCRRRRKGVDGPHVGTGPRWRRALRPGRARSHRRGARASLRRVFLGRPKKQMWRLSRGESLSRRQGSNDGQPRAGDVFRPRRSPGSVRRRGSRLACGSNPCKWNAWKMSSKSTA